jgi:DNA-binding XRE family transcriptional regulator
MLGEAVVDPPNRMREVRMARRLTHEQLAELVGTSRNTIGAVERGKHQPNVDLARRIARALDSDLNTVFGSADEPEPAEAAGLRWARR